MAILTKIRNRSGLAIGLVGLALGLFVISDALNTNNRIFGGTSDRVGLIDGEKISIRQFEAKVETILENYKKRMPNQPVDEGVRSQIRDQAWNEFINDHLMNKEYADVGISVSNEELEDLLFGNNIHSQIRQAFTDPKTGAFDKSNVIRYIKRVNESTDDNEKKQWRDFEDYVVNETMQRKYANLLKKGVYATKVEAKNLYNARSKSYELNFLALTYQSIPDSSIKEDESDMKSYFRKHQEKYKERDNSRKIDFVAWDFAPTAEDSAVVRNWAQAQVEPFRNAKNDTLFVDANSDTPFDTLAKTRNMFPDIYADRMFRDTVGAVYGPLFKDGKYKIFKITAIKYDTTYWMHALHILIKVEGATMQDTLNAKKKAEEILGKIRKGSDFGAMAAQYGTDGTKDRGGDLGCHCSKI